MVSKQDFYEFLEGAPDPTKERIARDAAGLFPLLEADEELRGKSKAYVRQIAVSLACDKNSCGYKTFKSGVKGAAPKMRDMARARKVTSVVQIMDPRERVESQAGILALNGYISAEDLDKVIGTAKDVLTVYKEYGEVKMFPTTLAAGSIYLSCLLEDVSPPPQQGMERALNIGGFGVDTRKAYQAILESVVSAHQKMFGTKPIVMDSGLVEKILKGMPKKDEKCAAA